MLHKIITTDLELAIFQELPQNHYYINLITDDKFAIKNARVTNIKLSDYYYNLANEGYLLVRVTGFVEMIKSLIVDSKVCVFVKSHDYFDGFLNIGRIKGDDMILIDRIFESNLWRYNLFYIVYSPPLYKHPLSEEVKGYYDEINAHTCDVVYINGLNTRFKFNFDDEIKSNEKDSDNIVHNFICAYYDVKDNPKSRNITKYIYGIKSTEMKKKIK